MRATKAVAGPVTAGGACDPTIADTLSGWDWQLQLGRDSRGHATGLVASTDRVRQLAFARVTD